MDWTSEWSTRFLALLGLESGVDSSFEAGGILIFTEDEDDAVLGAGADCEAERVVGPEVDLTEAALDEVMGGLASVRLDGFPDPSVPRDTFRTCNGIAQKQTAHQASGPSRWWVWPDARPRNRGW